EQNNRENNKENNILEFGKAKEVEFEKSKEVVFEKTKEVEFGKSNKVIEENFINNKLNKINDTLLMQRYSSFKKGNMFLLGSDAHIPSKVGDVELAKQIVEQSGVNISQIANVE
ncbi:MAG: hypothetical protein LBR30_08205, partial [Clostridioides sp.]|nr:hypothetical protein [Clostridioides sp.]